MKHWEEKRKEYQPEVVKVLFIGESAPNKDRFFYSNVVSEKDGLFRYTIKVIYKKVFKKNECKINILTQFMNDGYFLIDFFIQPGQKINSTLDNDIILFRERLKELNFIDNPFLVFTSKEVYKKISYLFNNYDQNKILSLPFPGNEHQNRYCEMLELFLLKHKIIL